MPGDGDTATAYPGIACKSPSKARSIVSELTGIITDPNSGTNNATARSSVNMTTSGRSSLTAGPQEGSDDPHPRSPHSASADHSIVDDSRAGIVTGAGDERGAEKEREREKAGGLGAMVTVSDLTDHPTKPHSLVFFLRVPVGGQDRGTDKGPDKRFEVELEFEFDLLNDNAHSVVAEMKECEELSSVPIDSEHITRLFAPFVKAGTRRLQRSLSSSTGSPSSAGLARAVIAEVCGLCLCTVYVYGVGAVCLYDVSVWWICVLFLCGVNPSQRIMASYDSFHTIHCLLGNRFTLPRSLSLSLCLLVILSITEYSD